MVRRPLLLLLFAALPIAAAVETTTITKTVFLPEGLKATGGTILCQISDSGTVDDAGTSQRVGGRMETSIAPDGSVNFTLIPNDAIIPAGTYYTCTIKTTGPKRSSWTELWSVTTSPDPVDIGDITRLEVAPGIVVGSYVEFVAVEPTGACVTVNVPTFAEDTDSLCECVASAWSCVVIGGGGTLDQTMTAGNTTTKSYKTSSGVAGGSTLSWEHTKSTSAAYFDSATVGARSGYVFNTSTTGVGEPARHTRWQRGLVTTWMELDGLGFLKKGTDDDDLYLHEKQTGVVTTGNWTPGAGTWNFTSASVTGYVSVGVDPPATCTKGTLYIDTDGSTTSATCTGGSAGVARMCGCTATNVWTGL